MFPDSEIANSFQLAETKSMYIAVHGVAPYIENLLTKRITDSGEYVLLFEESLNKTMQKKQMDLLVRFWDNDKIASRYFNSVLFGHGTAVDLYNLMEQHVENKLGYRGLIQLSRDGPNVNWSVYDKVQDRVATDYDVKLMNIGSCGLHTLHNKFKAGVDKTSWGIGNVLSSLHRLFKDVPARRDDYVSATGNNDFPLPFCQHGWVENVRVAERALSVYDDVSNYIKAVGSKKVRDPCTKSLDTVRDWVNDPLAKDKLSYFLFVAKPVESFLTTYQTDVPLIPFLCKDLSALVSTLMQRIVKPEVMEQSSDPLKLSKVDVTKTDNLKGYKQISWYGLCDRIRNEKGTVNYQWTGSSSVQNAVPRLPCHHDW